MARLAIERILCWGNWFSAPFFFPSRNCSLFWVVGIALFKCGFFFIRKDNTVNLHWRILEKECSYKKKMGEWISITLFVLFLELLLGSIIFNFGRPQVSWLILIQKLGEFWKLLPMPCNASSWGQKIKGWRCWTCFDVFLGRKHTKIKEHFLSLVTSWEHRRWLLCDISITVLKYVVLIHTS